MFGFKSPSQRDAVIHVAMKQIEKMLTEMADEGKDLTKLKLKKFQKTHATNCRCRKCEDAKKRKDPRLRGMQEDGFKVYIAEGDDGIKL